MDLESPREQLLAYFREQEFGPGDRLPSERRLAAILGLSTAAVNRAALFLIGRGVLRRSGYKLFIAEEETVPAPPLLVALISEKVPRRAAKEAAELCGCELALPDSREENHVRKAILDLRTADVDGILVWGHHAEDLLRPLVKAGVPLLMCATTSTDHSYVAVDPRRIGALAVEYLAGLGHRKIALVEMPLVANYGPNWEVVTEGYVAACRQAGLEEASKCIYRVAPDSRSDVETAWRNLDLARSGVTALICPMIRIAEGFFKLAWRDGVVVARDLSIMILEDSGRAVVHEPSVTALSELSVPLARIGMLLLNDMARSRVRRSELERHKVTVENSILARGSTAAVPGSASEGEGKRKNLEPRSWPQAVLWATEEKVRRDQVTALNHKPFPVGRGTREQYITLDLGPYANRTTTRQHGWLGDEPFRHLPVGEEYFHGVPFYLMNERKNNGTSAVVFRSEKARSSAGRALPVSLSLPIGQKVEAVYILHAAGWTLHHRAFAEYVFRFDARTSERIGVVPYAVHQPENLDRKEWAEESILQDWHPNRPRFESSHALPCVITDGGDPLLYERYVYAWQWRNPRPSRVLRSLEIEILDPDGSATLGILAITLQIPEGKGEK